MTPYEQLNNSGKLRRLHALALAALDHYRLDEPTLRFHAAVTNVHYRVTTRRGQRFFLRVASPGWRTLRDLQSEALWLEALARDTDIGAPEVIRTRAGEHTLALEIPGVLGGRHVTLMTRVPGRGLGRYLSVRNLERMGALFAMLHHHGKEWTPPPGFTDRRFEHWLSRGEANTLLSAPALDSLSTPQREMILRLHDHVESAYRQIDRADLRVIHGDLWHGNINLHHGVLHPFDFEDTVNGFRAHDIAMAMLDLLEETDDETYAGLLPAFRRGYEALLAWPDDPIEPLQVGRILWMMNYVAGIKAKRLPDMVARHEATLLDYERTGCLVKPRAG